MKFTRIALHKLNELLKRKEFVGIKCIDDDLVVIEFKDRVCKITSFANVTWIDIENKTTVGE